MSCPFKKHMAKDTKIALACMEWQSRNAALSVHFGVLKKRQRGMRMRTRYVKVMKFTVSDLRNMEQAVNNMVAKSLNTAEKW